LAALSLATLSLATLSLTALPLAARPSAPGPALRSAGWFLRVGLTASLWLLDRLPPKRLLA
jgi:hypothetical protein